MPPSLRLLNDHKMPPCAQHLRCSCCKNAQSLTILAVLLRPPENVWENGVDSISYHWTWQGRCLGALMQDARSIGSQIYIYIYRNTFQKIPRRVAQSGDNLVSKQRQLEKWKSRWRTKRFPVIKIRYWLSPRPMWTLLLAARCSPQIGARKLDHPLDCETIFQKRERVSHWSG